MKLDTCSEVQVCVCVRACARACVLYIVIFQSSVGFCSAEEEKVYWLQMIYYFLPSCFHSLYIWLNFLQTNFH